MSALGQYTPEAISQGGYAKKFKNLMFVLIINLDSNLPNRWFTGDVYICHLQSTLLLSLVGRHSLCGDINMQRRARPKILLLTLHPAVKCIYEIRVDL